MSDYFRRTMLAEGRAVFTVRRLEAFVLLTGITGDGPYLPFEPSINLGRLYTRHSLGIMEMERAERRKRRQGTPYQRCNSGD